MGFKPAFLSKLAVLIITHFIDQSLLVCPGIHYRQAASGIDRNDKSFIVSRWPGPLTPSVATTNHGDADALVRERYRQYRLPPVRRECYSRGSLMHCSTA
jgi:hypothetical protein